MIMAEIHEEKANDIIISFAKYPSLKHANKDVRGKRNGQIFVEGMIAEYDLIAPEYARKQFWIKVLEIIKKR